MSDCAAFFAPRVLDVTTLPVWAPLLPVRECAGCFEPMTALHAFHGFHAWFRDREVLIGRYVEVGYSCDPCGLGMDLSETDELAWCW